METQTGRYDLRHLKTVIARSWLLIALTTLAAAGAGAAWTATQDEVYESSAIIQIGNGATQSTQRLELDIATEVEVLKSRQIRQAAAESLGERGRQVTGFVSERLGTSALASLGARAPSAALARDAANAYAEAYIQSKFDQSTQFLQQQQDTFRREVDDIRAQITALDVEIDEASRDPGVDRALVVALVNERAGLSSEERDLLGQARELALEERLQRPAGVVQSANLPGSPDGSSPIRAGVLAGLLGALVGIAIAIVRDDFDDLVRTTEDLADLPAPVLVTVPPGGTARDGTAVILRDPLHHVSESFRVLRTNTQLVAIRDSLRSILFTSANAGEGKSIAAANLAIALATAGRDVVLVNADLRNPRAQDLVGIRSDAGLTSVVSGQAALDDALAEVTVPGSGRLRFLDTGPLPANPSELLTTKAVVSVLTRLTQHADYVIVDGPPMTGFADALVLAGLVDGAVAVVRTGKTHRSQLVGLGQRLEDIGTPLLGYVLTGSRARSSVGTPEQRGAVGRRTRRTPYRRRERTPTPR